MPFQGVTDTAEIKLQTLQFALASAGVGMWDVELVTPWTVIWDDRCKELFGIAKGNTIPYSEAIKCIHEDDRLAVDSAVKRALTPGSNGQYNMTYRTIGIDDHKVRWVNFIGKAHFDENNIPYRFVGIARDLTEEREQINEHKETKNNFRTIVEQSPIAIGLLQGPEMIIHTVNNTFLNAWDKSGLIIGFPLLEAIPELKEQPLIEMLEGVYHSGIPQHKNATKATLLRNGILEDVYFDFVYTPTRNTENEVTGVMILASIVTEQVIAKQKLEETEANLRDAIKIAELGTWSFDIEHRHIIYSQEMMDWYGFDSEKTAVTDILSSIVEEDRERLRTIFETDSTVNSPSIYNDEYTIINRRTNEKHIIQTIGKMVLNEKGIAIKIDGTARNVTKQRLYQFALENKVQQGTEDLAAVNEELQSNNKELVSLNEELEVSNNLLTKSNYALEQYAYIASHDLQEPLRKIRVYSSMMSEAGGFGEQHQKTVGKINKSAERMSLLIKNLLEFSRLIKPETVMNLVDLRQVVNSVTEDFELTIEEKKATIEINKLPSIEGNSLQMNQLFYNLISNALKFIQADTIPHISISNRLIKSDELIRYISKPLTYSNYYLISFTDNGIGFDPKFSEKIFEVFKRLHAQDVYDGSGIGLSLCRRIVNNHQGYIEAVSEPGKGTTFNIILPDRQ